jgi:probable HAF family extracellular repeat protein
MTDLGTLGGISSEAAALNSLGQVVGESRTGQVGTGHTPITHAFLWQNGAMTDLGTLHGGSSSAVAVNDHGQIVGSSDGHAVVWQNGSMTDLGTLPGDETSEADAINERGQIVGTSHNATGIDHAFLWENGILRPLDPTPARSSWATDINERGQVIGEFGSNPNSALWHAFVWERGKLTDLGTLRGRNLGSSADDINNHNQIVGWSAAPGGIHPEWGRPVLWTLRSG